jgi:hypothetical protein
MLSVTERFEREKTPQIQELSLASTEIGTDAPFSKQTPSKPSIIILAWHCSNISLFSLS